MSKKMDVKEFDYCRVVTTKNGWRLLKFRDECKNTYQFVGIDSTNSKNQDIINEMLIDWTTLRNKKPELWSRFNDPVLFGDAILKKEDPVYTAIGIVGYRDEKSICAFRGRLHFSNLIQEFGPYRVKNLKLKTLEVDYQAFVYEQDTDVSTIFDIISAVLKANLDLVILRNIPKDTQFLSDFKSVECSVKSVRRLHKRYKAVLYDSENNELQRYCSSKTLKKLRYRSRKLDKYFDGDVRVDVITKPDEIPDFIEHAGKIVEQTYQHALGIGIRRNDKALAGYLRQLSEKRVLRGYVLYARNEAIAYMVGDFISNRYSLWATSYLPEYADLSPGTVLIYHAIQDLIENGCHVFDFGVGDSRYKRIFSNSVLEEVDIFLFNGNSRSMLAYAITSNLEYGWGLLRKILEKKNLLDKTRRFVRSRLAN